MRQWSPLVVTVPAGTAIATPTSTTWKLYPGWLHRVRIDIPNGHNGFTGWRLVYFGTPVIPWDPATWITVSGRTFEIPWEDEILERGLVVQTYNTDVFPHTFYGWADVDPKHPGEPPANLSSPRIAAASAADLAAIARLTSSAARP